MLPFIQFRNLEYVRHFLHALKNYVFATSSIVANYYKLSQSSRFFEHQNQTSAPDDYNQIKFDLIWLQPIYNVQHQSIRLSSAEEQLPLLRGQVEQAQILISSHFFKPTIGERVAFSTSIETLLQRQSKIVYKVVGIEAIQSDIDVLYQLDIVRDTQAISEQELQTDKIYGFTPILNKYLQSDKFILALRAINLLEKFSYNTHILNDGIILDYAKFKLNLQNDPAFASLLKNVVGQHLEPFVIELDAIKAFEVAKVASYSKNFKLPRFALNFEFIVIPCPQETVQTTRSRSWRTLRYQPVYKVYPCPHEVLAKTEYYELNIDEKIDQQKSKSLEQLIDELENKHYYDLEDAIKALVVVKKLKEL